MEFQFAFELQTGLRVGFFSAEFEDGVAEQAVSVRIFWIELNGLAKFGDRRFRKMADGARFSIRKCDKAGDTPPVYPNPKEFSSS